MKTFTLYLFGRELLSVMRRNSTEASDDTMIEFASATTFLTEHDPDEADGISYACGRCGEVLVAGLQRALTPRDEADLLTVHECTGPGEESGQPVS